MDQKQFSVARTSYCIAYGGATDGHHLHRTSSSSIRRTDRGMIAGTGLCMEALITEGVVGTEGIIPGGASDKDDEHHDR